MCCGVLCLKSVMGVVPLKLDAHGLHMMVETDDLCKQDHIFLSVIFTLYAVSMRLTADNHM